MGFVVLIIVQCCSILSVCWTPVREFSSVQLKLHWKCYRCSDWNSVLHCSIPHVSNLKHLIERPLISICTQSDRLMPTQTDLEQNCLTGAFCTSVSVVRVSACVLSPTPIPPPPPQLRVSYHVGIITRLTCHLLNSHRLDGRQNLRRHDDNGILPTE